MGVRLDVTGERYGRLVAIRMVHVDSESRRSIWLWQCDCGSIVERKLFNVRRGDTTSCGCRQREIARSLVANMKLDPGESSLRSLINHYQYRAKKIGIAWELTKSEFAHLTKMDCHYCGMHPHKPHRSHPMANGSYIYNGLDRVDNAGGYTRRNTVACCHTCNRAKSTMTKEEFVSWIMRAADFQGRRGG